MAGIVDPNDFTQEYVLMCERCAPLQAVAPPKVEGDRRFWIQIKGQPKPFWLPNASELWRLLYDYTSRSVVKMKEVEDETSPMGVRNLLAYVLENEHRFPQTFTIEQILLANYLDAANQLVWNVIEKVWEAR